MPKHKLDGFYHAAHEILHKRPTQVRMKLRSRASVVPTTPVEKIEKFSCISCFTEHNVFERNIRGRILRGYIVYKNGKTLILDAHSGGGKVSPCYHNGRLCEKCFPKYSTQSSTPTDYKSIQLLKDVQKPLKRDSVTIRQVDREDEDQDREVEQLRKDARPKVGKLAIEVGKVAVRNDSEPIDNKAFHKFMRARGGGKKDYEQALINRVDSKDANHYDDEVPFDNIKSDKRWFNRG